MELPPIEVECAVQILEVQIEVVNTFHVLHLTIDRTEFLKLYLDEFDKLIQIYTSKGMSTIVSMWLNHAKGLNSPIVVRTQHNELTGIFKGLDSDGMLQLKTIDDKVVSISAGDVFFDENGENKK